MKGLSTVIVKLYTEISWDINPREVILGHTSFQTTMKGTTLCYRMLYPQHHLQQVLVS